MVCIGLLFSAYCDSKFFLTLFTWLIGRIKLNVPVPFTMRVIFMNRFLWILCIVWPFKLISYFNYACKLWHLTSKRFSITVFYFLPECMGHSLISGGRMCSLGVCKKLFWKPKTKNNKFDQFLLIQWMKLG